MGSESDKKTVWTGPTSVALSFIATTMFAAASIGPAFVRGADVHGLMLGAIFIILMAIFIRLK